MTTNTATALRISDTDWTDRIDFPSAWITAESAEVTVTDGYGIRAWIAEVIGLPDDFEDGREFVAQEREIDRETKTGTITWALGSDGIYEFGNMPTGGGSHTRGFFVIEGARIARLGYSRKSDVLATFTPTAPSPRRRRSEGF